MVLRLLPRSTVPLTSPVTWRVRLRDWVTESCYRLLHRAGVPGAIRPMHVKDALTGHTVTVRLSLYYTILTVDGRDFYFHRVTGKLDGTGMAL